MERINLNKDRIIKILEEIFESKVKETKEELKIEDKKSGDVIYITKKELEHLIRELDNYYQDEGKTVLFNDYYFEKSIALLNESKWSEFKIYFDGKKLFKLEKGNLTLEISLPSFKYLTFYLMNNIINIRMRHYYHFYQYLRQKSIFERLIEENLRKQYKTKKSLFKFVLQYVNFFTLKICSKQKLSFEDFINIYDSLLFEINLKLKIPVISPEEVWEGVEITMKGRKRKLKFPENRYNKELMYYYISAIQITEPEWVYLSYYHIIEYFFDSIYEREIKDLCKNQNIKELIKLIRKYKEEEEKLKLVLENFIEFKNLQDYFLKSYNKKSWEYYFREKVDFVNKDTILDKNNFIKTLAKRIYYTRNAIVHSKESFPSRYNPFKDSEALAREIPLIQSIAELIILKTAEKIRI